MSKPKAAGDSRLFAGRVHYWSLAASDNSIFPIAIREHARSAARLHFYWIWLSSGAGWSCRRLPKSVGPQRATACDSESRGEGNTRCPWQCNAGREPAGTCGAVSLSDLGMATYDWHLKNVRNTVRLIKQIAPQNLRKDLS